MSQKDYLRKYNWVWFSLGYVNSALLSLDAILREEDIPEEKMDVVWMPPSSVEDVPIVIFYNIRHAIELVIKTTGVYKGTAPVLVHDIKRLLPALETEYPGKSKTIEQFVNLTKKYYGTDFYKDNFGAVLPDDPKNILFRYPENKAMINHIDPAIIGRVHKKLAREIKRDVEQLRVAIYRFHGELAGDKLIY